MSKKLAALITTLIILVGCAQVTSLNLRKHQFGRIPTKIVWIQVAGLSPEHLSLLKYSYPNRDQKTAFENSLCVGNTWEYNLYNIRPSAYSGFLSQISGKKNVQNQCKDYEHKPVWKYVAAKGYKVGIFEGETSTKNSLLKSKSCKEQANYLEDAIFWKMSRPLNNSKKFHINERVQYKANNVYYDKSCSTGDCFTNFSRNIQSSYKDFSRNSKNHLYLVRNFKYQKLLKQRKVKQAKLELEEINATLAYFQKLASKSNDMLVLLSSAESIEVDFPRAGSQWKKYEKNGKFLISRNSKLISTVYASGARAENFCGIYDQNQLMARIFSGARQQGLEFSIINPFDT